MKITVLDPALCCSTGVCGPEVDDTLVTTAANIKALRTEGHDVQRLNIARDGEDVKQFPVAIEKLQQEGMDSLPYILIEDQLVAAGAYPSWAGWQELLAKHRGEPAPNPGPTGTADPTSGCSGSGCC